MHTGQAKSTTMKHMNRCSGSTYFNLMVKFEFIILLSVFDQTKVVFTKDDGSDMKNIISVDASQSLIWGPGLDSVIVLPARYFEIQLVNEKGDNLTHSVGDNPFDITVTNKRGRARVWVRTVDRQDGSYVVQYKVNRSLDSLTIAIIFDSHHVGQSPYKLKGPLYSEECDCPSPSLDSWMDTMSCSRSYAQIQEDLLLFPKINMTYVEIEVDQRFNKRKVHSLCHYVIKENKIYRKTYGKHVSFKMFMDAILLSLTRKVQLPDVEFFMNLGDWPLVKHDKPDRIPMLSWCGSDATYDIIMPTYDLTRSTLTRVSLDMVFMQGASSQPWEDKSPLAFWRGRDSRKERLELVRMSHRHPDIIDARLTKMFFFKKEDDLGELAKHISFVEFFKYKYQLNIDGTVAAYRFPYLLAGDTIVLKQDSPYYEHFYKSLKPYEHYIPFKRDLSDLIEQIQWAKDNDEKVQKMITNARHFVHDNLMADHIFCYHAALFKEYAKLLVSPVEVREEMDLVEQPSGIGAKCECFHKPAKAREEL